MSRRGIVLLASLGGLAFAGIVSFAVYYATSDFRLSSLLPNGATKTPQFRASYVESTKKSCVKATTARSTGASAQQIETYCACMANGSVDLLTDDDVKYMMDHLGSMPPELEQRLQPLLQVCLRQASLKK